MLKFKSIRTELTVTLTASLALILIVISFLSINKVADDTKAKVELGLSNALKQQALEIKNFIKGKGKFKYFCLKLRLTQRKQ